MAYLLLYVNDIILANSSDSLRERIITQLKTELPMSDLGPLSHFLGIAITRTPSYMLRLNKLCTWDYRAGRYSVSLSPLLLTLSPNLVRILVLNFRTQPNTATWPVLFSTSLLLILILSYIVQQVCLFMHDPREAYYDAFKCILWYLQGNIDHGLHLYPSTSLRLITYTYADWGGYPDTQRSTLVYCCFLGDNLISWSSKRQATLSRSSAEAKYRSRRR